MIKHFLLLITLLFPTALFAGQSITKADLIGTWDFEGYPWQEGYEFKSDGTIDYIVRGKARNYQYDLVNNEIIIKREFNQTINRIIESFDGKTMKLRDTFLDKTLTLKKVKEI